MKTYCCYGDCAGTGHSRDCRRGGGFFDLPQQKRCQDQGHAFPTHLYIPPGKGYRHVCPSCGASTTVAVPGQTLEAE